MTQPNATRPRHGRVDYAVFAKAIAAGKPQLEALQLAGSRCKSPFSASSLAGKLLAKPEVAEMVAAEKETFGQIVEAGLLAGVREVVKVAKRTAPNVTNRDLVSACYLLGKLSGDIIDRTEVSHTVEFRGFGAPRDPEATTVSIVAPPLPALPAGTPEA